MSWALKLYLLEQKFFCMYTICWRCQTASLHHIGATM